MIYIWYLYMISIYDIYIYIWYIFIYIWYIFIYIWYVSIYIYMLYIYIYICYTYIYIYIFCNSVPFCNSCANACPTLALSPTCLVKPCGRLPSDGCSIRAELHQYAHELSAMALLELDFAFSQCFFAIEKHVVPFKNLRFFTIKKKLSHHAFGKLVRSSGLLRSIVDKWWHMMLMRGGEGHVFSFLSTKFTLKHGENLSVLYEFHTIRTCVHGEFPSQPMFNYPPRRMYPNSIVI